MSPAVVDRIAGRRKVGIGKRPNGDADAVHLALLGVEERCPAHWAETELELGALITGADVLRCLSEDSVWCREAGKCREDAACSLLAGEAMADADKARLPLNFDAKLTTVTRSCP